MSQVFDMKKMLLAEFFFRYNTLCFNIIHAMGFTIDIQ